MLNLLGYSNMPRIVGNPDLNFPTKDAVGVEIEMEGVDREAEELLEDSLWIITEDGSLKNQGAEFIFSEPFAGDAITQALEEMRTYLGTKSGQKCEATDRCSVHVHVDIRDLTPKQLYKYLLLYVLYEKQLYEVAGSNRAKNNNCLPVSTADTFMRAVNIFKDDQVSIDRVHEAVRACGKYVGCNVKSITYGYDLDDRPRGSVEFRMHRGTKDVDEIRYWITLLLRMKAFARSDFDPDEIAHQFSALGPEKYTEQVFGDLTPLLVDQPHFVEDLYDGVRNVECIKEYDELEQFAAKFTAPPVGPPKPPKRRPKYPPDAEEFNEFVQAVERARRNQPERILRVPMPEWVEPEDPIDDDDF